MRPRVVHEREDRVLTELCECLALREGVRVNVLRRPDREARANGGCDAIIRRGAVEAAVEITRLFAAPQRPKFTKRLDEIRSTIAAPVTAAFPNSIVMVGVPAEDFTPGSDWQALASAIADAVISAMRPTKPGVRVPLTVPGMRTRAFAQRLWDGVPEAFCAVNPVVWGRDPEDLTVDDMCRALSDKRASMLAYRREGLQTILLLDCEDLSWVFTPPDLFGRAILREDPGAFDEVYFAASAHVPSLIIPLKLGTYAPVGQPELGEFIGLRQEIERARGLVAARVGPHA